MAEHTINGDLETLCKYIHITRTDENKIIITRNNYYYESSTDKDKDNGNYKRFLFYIVDVLIAYNGADELKKYINKYSLLKENTDEIKKIKEHYIRLLNSNRNEVDKVKLFEDLLHTICNPEYELYGYMKGGLRKSKKKKSRSKKKSKSKNY